MVGIFCTRSSIIEVIFQIGFIRSPRPRSPTILVANPFIPHCWRGASTCV
nr:MAG TPA: hypothetical protein [Caudoviricetes sp.]